MEQSTKHATASVVGEQLQVDGRPIPGIICKSTGAGYTLRSSNGAEFTVTSENQLTGLVNFLSGLGFNWAQSGSGANPSITYPNQSQR